ncbi:hypothetical protein CI105_07025 [Candidatus Izimaplasma bacterium ZiA1]|uniref:hypothetical protein n=1 Tax=Candidatus Izimoplasma sp. ZiA1 TaxID=2024899 RepID=UPI000BAA4CDE|nr:hypothetical protein CI105_07025 [Candidatus Izimaplasma bacterium ZiA1]
MKKYFINLYTIVTGVFLLVFIGYKENVTFVGSTSFMFYFIAVVLFVITLFTIIEILYTKRDDFSRIKVFLLVISFALFVRIFIDLSSHEVEVIFSIVFISGFSYLTSYNNETVLKLSKTRQTVIIFLFLLAIEISSLLLSYINLANEM